MKVIIDTDALLGIFNPADSHHSQTVTISKNLAEKNIDTEILTTTLGEFALLATSKIGLKPTQHAIKILSETMTIIETTREITQAAISIYEKQTSKEESLFDCFIMAAAKLQKMDAVFSFDKGYKKTKNHDLNIKLVSELFLNINW